MPLPYTGQKGELNFEADFVAALVKKGWDKEILYHKTICLPSSSQSIVTIARYGLRLRPDSLIMHPVPLARFNFFAIQHTPSSHSDDIFHTILKCRLCLIQPVILHRIYHVYLLGLFLSDLTYLYSKKVDYQIQ